jgi:hydroxypyruvate isomerase
MPKFNANLSDVQRSGLPGALRRAAGRLPGVEFLFPYADKNSWPKSRAGTTSRSFFNMPPGDWNAGDGVACDRRG